MIALIAVSLIVSISVMIALTRYFRMHAFFALLIAAFLCGIISGQPVVSIISAMQDGFGTLLRQIGFLVAIGSCLGIMLEKTGAMEVLSVRLVNAFGAKRSALAMTVMGVIVGIPVFCDSGFIILTRLIPSISAQTGISAAQLSLALSSGLYTTHTLVPPTPGPLAAATNLGLSNDMGLMIVAGIIVSIPVAFAAYLFTARLSKGIEVEIAKHQPAATRDLNPWMCAVPLVLPIILIAMSSLPRLIELSDGIKNTFIILGNPIVALSIGLAISFFLLPSKNKNTSDWPAWISEALKDAGVIILITGAGGAFGSVIKATGIESALSTFVESTSVTGIMFLIVGYLVAAALKTAQGSTTTAMIISSSMLAPLLTMGGLTNIWSLTALVLAIGGGAMTVSHANDSYFWVVSQFSGIKQRDALRSYTLITFIQGLVALASSIILFSFT